MVRLFGCPWELLTSKLAYNLVRGRIQPTYTGVIFHLHHGHPSRVGITSEMQSLCFVVVL